MIEMYLKVTLPDDYSPFIEDEIPQEQWPETVREWVHDSISGEGHFGPGTKVELVECPRKNGGEQ